VLKLFHCRRFAELNFHYFIRCGATRGYDYSMRLRFLAAVAVSSLFAATSAPVAAQSSGCRAEVAKLLGSDMSFPPILKWSNQIEVIRAGKKPDELNQFEQALFKAIGKALNRDVLIDASKDGNFLLVHGSDIEQEVHSKYHHIVEFLVGAKITEQDLARLYPDRSVCFGSVKVDSAGQGAAVIFINTAQPLEAQKQCVLQHILLDLGLVGISQQDLVQLLAKLSGGRQSLPPEIAVALKLVYSDAHQNFRSGEQLLAQTSLDIDRACSAEGQKH